MRQDRRVRSGKASSLLPSPTFLSASSSLIRRVAVKTLGMRLFSSAEGEMKQEGKEEEQRVVLFRTPSSGINAFRVYGAIAYSIFGVGLYLTPQLLAEHDWAPLWLRTAMAGMVLFFGGGLVPLYALYLKKNIFNVTLERDKVVVTTLSPLLYRTEDELIPLARIHPEPRQGKWLRIIVRDAKYGDKKLKTLYLERTGKFVQYRQLESIVKTGSAPPPSSAAQQM
jgi:hypothetical protein